MTAEKYRRHANRPQHCWLVGRSKYKKWSSFPTTTYRNNGGEASYRKDLGNISSPKSSKLSSAIQAKSAQLHQGQATFCRQPAKHKQPQTYQKEAKDKFKLQHKPQNHWLCPLKCQQQGTQGSRD